MRLAFLIPAFDVGGAERVVIRTASRLAARGHDVVVAGFLVGSGRLLDDARVAGLRTVVISDPPSISILLVAKLYRWLRRERPDVLLTFMFHANISGRITGRLARVPVIIGSERVVGWESRTRIRVNRWTAWLSDAITTNSEAGRRFWADALRIAPEKVNVIHNGIDTAEFSPAPFREPGDLRIGVLARLHRANGHDWFLHALAALAKNRAPGWRCTMCGDGPEADRLGQLAVALGLQEYVTFAGHCGDSVRFLRSLDIYAHPSLVAGMPNAVLEAMACGLPVVATKVGGTPEAVADGVTGWLCEPGDVAGAAVALERLLNQPEWRASMGAAGRARAVQRFSLDSAAAAVDVLVQQLTSTARARVER